MDNNFDYIPSKYKQGKEKESCQKVILFLLLVIGICFYLIARPVSQEVRTANELNVTNMALLEK